MAVGKVEGTGMAPKWGGGIFSSVLPNPGIHFHQQGSKECVPRKMLLKNSVSYFRKRCDHR